MNLKTTLIVYQFPKNFFAVVLLLCALPIGLNLAGFDFGSEVHGFHVKEIASWEISDAALTDEMFYNLTGALEHGLLEWSAVSVAALTVLLAFAYFSINKDITTPIIGVALFCSGTMDAFHTLAAMRLIDSVADNSNLLPFTWALSRGFNATILLIGALICLKLKSENSPTGISQIVIVSLLFSGLAYFLITYSATSESLPVTQFPDAIFTRPYDVVPLLLFVISGPVFWKLYKKVPNLLTSALFIALIPEIFLEAHMAFGSSALFDNHFNIAHFLKILAYLIPFIGLVLDYIGIYKKLNDGVQHLRKVNQEREELILSLHEIQHRNEAILDNTVDAIITIDAEGSIDQFNLAAENIFGYKAFEVIGKNVKMLMPEPYFSEHDDYLKKSQIKGNSPVVGITRDLSGLRKDGTVFPMNLAIGKISLESGIMFSGIIRDISNVVQLEKEQNRLIENLRGVNSELEEFTYRTSHDLKAPLINIRGLSTFMKEDLEEGNYEEVATNIERVHKLTSRLESLVDDIVDVSKIDKESNRFEETDLEALVEMIKEDLETLINDHQVEVQVSRNGSPTLRLPKKLITRVLENLVSNAVKYSDPDKDNRFVKIDFSESNGSSHIQVSDNGLGIPDQYRDQVFGMFKRFHQSRSFGSGLGLYLVKKNINKVKGDIDLESSPEGSLFKIKIPIPETTEKSF